MAGAAIGSDASRSRSASAAGFMRALCEGTETGSNTARFAPRAESDQRLRALDGPHAAADLAGQGPADLGDERRVVAASLRRIQIDQLNDGKAAKAIDPALEIVARDAQAFALFELDDASVHRIN